VRRRLGFPYWSLSKWAKLKVKEAVNFIGEFENALAGEANKVGVDGVVCGHIHHAVIAVREGIEYVNTGDWVESCTAIVEHHDGRFELIDWAHTVRERAAAGLVTQVEDEPATAEPAGSRKPARAA